MAIKGWHVTDARLAVGNLEINSPLTAQQRRDLLQANQAESEVIALYRAGDYREAIPIEQRVLAIRRQIVGPNHTDTSSGLNNVALMYDSLADYAKAEPLYREALEINQKVLGEDHPRTATSLSNLAELYRAIGDFAKAEPLCRQAFEIDKSAWGKITRLRPGPSTTWPSCTLRWGTMRRRSRSAAGA